MSRLIDAEHFEQMLIDLIDNGDHKNAYVHHAYKMRNIAIKECRNMLWEEPTVDAVPVVRCIECKYASFSFHQGELYISCENNNGLFRDVPEGGYCYCGEKVTE